MSQAGRILKNFSILFACRIFVRIFSFILVVLIARLLGDEGMGRYTFIFSYVTLFAVFADFGINEMLIREISKDKDRARSYVGAAFLLKGLLSFLVLLVLVFSDRFFHLQREVYLAIVLWGLASILNTFSGVIISLFRPYELMEFEAASQILNTILAAILGLLVLLLGYGIPAIFLMYLLSSLINFFFVLCLSFKTILKIRIRKEDFQWAWPLFRLAFPFAWGTIFGAVIARVDVVMLQAMRNEAEVGWYGAPYRLIEIFMFFPSTFTIAIYPAMSRYYKESIEKWHQLYQHGLKAMFILGLPIALGTTLIAPRLIPLLFGVQFLKSVPALQILIWRAFLIFFTGGIFAIVVTSSYNVHYFNVFAFVATLVNIGLNMVLIPRYGYIGCSVATVATELIIFVSGLFILTKIIKQKAKFGILARPLLAGIVMFGATWTFRALPLWEVVLMAAAVYSFSLFLMKAWTKEEVELLMGLMKRKSVKTVSL